MAVKPNYYETLYVVRPDLQEEDLAKIQQKLQDSIFSNQGEIIKDEKWAERDLAYEIQDHKRGIYYILVYNALPNASKEIEKHLQFYRTDVLRFMTLKTTEEAVNKNKASQEKSEKTEPIPPATPPTPPPAAPTPPTAAPTPPTAAPTPPPTAAPASTEEATTETAEPAESTQEEGGTN